MVPKALKRITDQMVRTETDRLNVTIELGHTRLDRHSVEQLRTGTLVALEQTVEEPLNIFARGTLVARGTVLVVDNQFCVRVTDIVAHVNALA